MALANRIDKSGVSRKGLKLVANFDPYTEHDIDENHLIMVRELIYSTLTECLSMGQARAEHLTTKPAWGVKKGVWRLRFKRLDRKTRRLEKWIVSSRFEFLLRTYRLPAEQFKAFLRDVLEGKQIEIAQKLLEEYNLHIKRGRKKQDD